MKAADKIKATKLRKKAQKEIEIDAMGSEQVKEELLSRKMQVFGTNQERKDRLKKAWGVSAEAATKPSLAKQSSKSNVVDKIKEMEEKRNERRK